MDISVVVINENKSNKHTLDLINKSCSSLSNYNLIEVDYDNNGWQNLKTAMSKIKTDYSLFVKAGDTWTGNIINEIKKAASKGYEIISFNKIDPDGNKMLFNEADTGAVDLNYTFTCMPFCLSGTCISTKLFEEFAPDSGIKPNCEKKLLLSAAASIMRLYYASSIEYRCHDYYEGEMIFYKYIYEKEAYIPTLKDFWIPFISELKMKYNEIPTFIQYHVMFNLNNNFAANRNNKNKHCIEGSDVNEYFEYVKTILNDINDKVIFNVYKSDELNINNPTKWIYGIIKYGDDFKFSKYYCSGSQFFGFSNTVIGNIQNLKATISFMEIYDGNLEIDGLIHPILFSMSEKIVIKLGDLEYTPIFNGRYAIEKTFGKSMYKSHAFHVSIPLNNVKCCNLYVLAYIDSERITINLSYDSHFSRVSDAFENSYWAPSSNGKHYLFTKDTLGMKIMRVKKNTWKTQEKKLRREMLRKHDKKALIFYAIRRCVFLAKKFKRHPIWMYLDKIYKGGDSSEYLYRYASDMKDDIKHYYLIDKKAPDYKRLKKMGYKPLVRGSIKHRLIFLIADMMVISNSTVMAFNNYGKINSSYVRDLINFHVCCVQHGMSVQKIAIAQNRLRDNTRLYFCASKYEIENLSKPIYDYIGYKHNALKLTGVPRYDGLVDRKKKQIIISPTWRMQAAVPVRGRMSEAKQREYNPLFKESAYFKVYNSLINDERLISAAKQHDYRIKYILHPIVSSQVNDFDKNNYVDIIPAAGDMSYEDMFCESALMVTDFSGVQFDFAYMRKPVVYLHHNAIPQHYEEGTFFYDTMGFGEICHDNNELIDLLIDYMKHDCVMKEEYRKRADDFFTYDDHNNCARIYQEMLKYQNKYILNGKNVINTSFNSIELIDRGIKKD